MFNLTFNNISVMSVLFSLKANGLDEPTDSLKTRLCKEWNKSNEKQRMSLGQNRIQNPIVKL